MRSVAKSLFVALALGVAQPAAPALSTDANDVSGADIFERYCALCHGADGRGAGPVAEAMTRPAADLTQISKRNNGVFPFSRVAATVRDGGGVAEHSRARMPAWGKIFSEDGDPIRAKATIFEVTQYVESLQEK
jgi:mono/diheme cytochrome c family protein